MEFKDHYSVGCWHKVWRKAVVWAKAVRPCPRGVAAWHRRYDVGTLRLGHATLARASGRAALAVALTVYFPGASAPILETHTCRHNRLPFRTM